MKFTLLRKMAWNRCHFYVGDLPPGSGLQNNNFPAGAGQIVWSNLFLLGHIPFWAGQTSITSCRYKSAPSPLHMMFKYETSKFSKHLIIMYITIDLNAGKVERMVQQNQYHICAYCYCFSFTSYIRLVMFTLPV